MSHDFFTQTLGRNDEIEPFVKRLVSLQTNEGTWKLYEDEKGGNLSATIQDMLLYLLGKIFERSYEYEAS